MTTEIAESWYASLIEELADIITETGFTSRWALIEGYHAVGTRILQENDNFERAKIYNEQILQRIANSLGKSPRTLYYAVQFVRTYPDLNLLPEGKDCSWSKVVNKYLAIGDKKRTITKADLSRMIKEIKEFLEHERLDAFSEGRTPMVTFICYLQDQIEKIIGELKGGMLDPKVRPIGNKYVDKPCEVDPPAYTLQTPHPLDADGNILYDDG